MSKKDTNRSFFDMHNQTFQLGPLETNCNLIHTDEGFAVAVDVGGDPSPMLEFMENKGLTLNRILLTHMHHDHVYGAAALHRATGAGIFACAKDAFLLERSGGTMPFGPVEPFEYEPVEPGRHVILGQPMFVLETPGHTPGSMSFYFPWMGAVFCGDLLFARNVGRTDLEGGDVNQLFESIQKRIFTLPDDTVVYPGHGPMTLVGDEKRLNPFFNDDAPEDW